MALLAKQPDEMNSAFLIGNEVEKSRIPGPARRFDVSQGRDAVVKCTPDSVPSHASVVEELCS